MNPLKIVRSPKKNPKESHIISANDWLKTDPYDEGTGIPSHFGVILDGLCCSIEREGTTIVRMRWISAVEE
jgi:hypothetical protein